MMVNVGDKVAWRTGWPYQGAHPDCWQRPHRGTVVPYNDPRLWFGTLAFGTYSYPNGPTQEQVDAHCEALRKRKDMPDDRGTLGVVWDWTDEKTGRVGVSFFNPGECIPYAEALANYNEAKRTAQAEELARRAARELATV